MNVILFHSPKGNKMKEPVLLMTLIQNGTHILFPSQVELAWVNQFNDDKQT